LQRAIAVLREATSYLLWKLGMTQNSFWFPVSSFEC